MAVALFSVSMAFGFGCSNSVSSESGGTAAATPQTPEAAYAATPTTYTGSTTTVTATATFNRYDDGVVGLSAISTAHPIRYAEVHVLDSSGARIQQGETDGSGNISVIIPRTAGSYTLRVNSRADNSFYRASVLNNPYDQVYYSLDTAFSLLASDATKSVTITAAQATNASNLLGGAFNILDQLYVANQFIRDEGNLACAAGCVTTFVSAPKIPVYWSKGVSPGTYYGSPSSRISFFTNVSSGNVYRGLYILGGVQSEVCTDTDHFDRSVILHEYGHFLEAAYGKSSSPGGSHDGNSIIDPRLAWSEGWADYFQAAALGRSFYRDTSSNSGCSGGASLSFPDFQMEAKNGTDSPTASEGVFREMSVARSLYDMMTGPSQSGNYGNTNNSDSQAADLGFNLVWHSFKAMANSVYKIQNAGIFNEIIYGYTQASGTAGQKTALGAYDASTATSSGVLGNEFQNNNQKLYGRKLTVQAGTCAFQFTPTPVGTAPKADTLDGQGNVVYSDFLRNNAFYRYDYDGNPANAYISLFYSASGTPYDLDLYVYTENYVYLDGSTLAKYSVRTQPESGAANAQSGLETIDLSNKGAGTYIINVKVDYNTPRAATTYYLQMNSGNRLCP